jgi:hypothetical protein
MWGAREAMVWMAEGRGRREEAMVQCRRGLGIRQSAGHVRMVRHEMGHFRTCFDRKQQAVEHVLIEHVLIGSNRL